ncbi:MAG: OB-fold nucleic acid binding domain-containing protein [Bacilli bacterium]
MKVNNANINIGNVEENCNFKRLNYKKRNLGGLVFIDLRDRSGIIQLVINTESPASEIAMTLKSGYVIEATGNVVKRQTSNPNLKTGEIEVEVSEIEILNEYSDFGFTFK